MGWNFGCAIIDFDFHSVVDMLLEPERRQFLTGAETPEEAQSKAQIDAGTVALEALGLSSAPDDAPISFSDATSRDFDGYAVGVVDGKTVIVGRQLGLEQDAAQLAAAYARVSAERGAVVTLWFNDASDSYMLSIFQGGARIRLYTSGPGLDDNEGERTPYEPEVGANAHEHLMKVLIVVIGRPFIDLLQLPMERFSAC
jgi:hypothetical protein